MNKCDTCIYHELCCKCDDNYSNWNPIDKKNNFEEVVDFFNDIMKTLYKDFNDYKVSSESVIYARNRVYDVFSRRYKIKEIEKR